MTLRYIGLTVVSMFFLIGGVSHFRSSDLFLSIVPPYIPYPLAAVYISGVAELVGGVAVWIRKVREWAGVGLIALTICVTPANVYMWMNPQRFPNISETLLGIRLILQIGLIVLIWWSTRIQVTRPDRIEN